MSEFNFRVTLVETGWIEVHARDEAEALLKLKVQYPSKNDLYDGRKWVEGEVTKIELQKESGDVEVKIYD